MLQRNAMKRRAFFVLVFVGLLGMLGMGNSYAQEKPTTVSGIVQSADGQGLAKARVYLQPSDGRAPHTALTDAEGRYQFMRVRPGLYDLRAQANGKWTELQRNVNVHAGEEVTVNLKFGAGKP
ncbi:MAG TPA: carboxypeptidase-like regulatory domain-containing protein [Candidatus Acidoferrales bacterium]|jgi:protocatechuate 3,4-dioxygenase beta subunit|nr:carboxypeptidase-like regulatory domain-containing protein [Candidatus Acidoferrales bacterium]